MKPARQELSIQMADHWRMPFIPGSDDTIAAISTPPGRGAIAVVRLSGSRAHEIAARVVSPWRDEERSVYLAALSDPVSGELIDRPLVTAYRAPASYTGEHMAEISVHGGEVVPALALAAVIAAGARHAHPGEFTRRAVMNGKLDLLQAEAVGDIIDAGSRAMHHAALHQLDGGLTRRISMLRETILELEALVAYDIDFPEEDDGPIAAQRVASAIADLLGSLDSALATSGTGELVRRGAIVVIAGGPNIGKSSLFNALIGYGRAIVTDVPGTTRDALEALIDVGEWPVRLIDTAGIRETSDVIERLGIEVSERWLRNADIVLACGDSMALPVEVARQVTAMTEAPVIPVRTKGDLLGESIAISESAVIVSAHTGAGLASLAQRIQEVLSAKHGELVQDTPLLTRERHHQAVAVARQEVIKFQEAWQSEAVPVSIAAVHLRAATGALEDLIGAVGVEEVLDRVFSSFCVGK
ncbi:MAG: tRNA uridine-5-carboxymethylaminomethyl(34) synthesis GTPase MnmE [Gemmatimonadaceae bacterium]